jgi:hypothetical protein
MTFSRVKHRILEIMLLHDKPMRAVQVAKETGKKFPSVMMHIIGLKRMEYVDSPEKGLYAITRKGKKALGIPEINKENAKAILAPTPSEKAFNFYADIGKPLGLCAYGLQDFCDKILKVNADSIEFHVNRGDFEAWFAGLGDTELARKVALLKEKKMVEEELRRKLHEIVESRCMVLANVAEHAVPPE